MPDGAALDNHWDEARAATMGPAEILVYRSHLLAGDRRITNFGGGIGLASARRLLGEGACVVLSDIDWAPLDDALKQLQAQYGPDSGVGLWGDVTDEGAIAALFRAAAWHYGGLDIRVSNAGIALAAIIEETSLAIW